MTEDIAIVGANLAGGRAAEALRIHGFEGRIRLIGAEPHPPYERPPLSKDVLLESRAPESTYIRSRGEWDALDVETLFGTTVTRLLPSDGALELDDGRQLRTDKVLLATGAHVRRLAIPGIELPGVHHLRTIDDAIALRAAFTGSPRVVVVGAGFIGAEVAACARQRGCDVTIVEPASVPLWRGLGSDVGALFAQIHRDHGVIVRTSEGVESIQGDRTVEIVTTSSGRTIPADVVVVGIGVIPAVELAESAGIRVRDGILVNERCETSLAGVYAAGDVALHPNPILKTQLRLEHWQNAQNQGVAAARSMLGHGEPFAEVPWFWSDQYDVNLQVAGHPQPTDTVVWRGQLGAGGCMALFLRDGRLVGAVGLNRGREVRYAMKLIERRAAIAPLVLADESTDLKALLKVA